MSFAQFVNWLPHAPHFFGGSQSDFLDGVRLDAVVRVERIGEIVDLPPFSPLHDKLLPVPHNNASQHDPWWTYYTNSLADAVLRHFAVDFESFGYATDMPSKAGLWRPVPRTGPPNTAFVAALSTSMSPI